MDKKNKATYRLIVLLLVFGFLVVLVDYLQTDESAEEKYYGEQAAIFRAWG